MFTVSYVSAIISLTDYIAGYRDADKFIAYCRACPRYGNSWSCPPFENDFLQTCACYHFVHILGAIIRPGDLLKKQCLSLGNASNKTEEIVREARVQLDADLLSLEKNHPGSRALYAGSCIRCSEGTCTRIHRLPCRNPGLIRPSLEALGFDIGATSADLLDTPLKWSTNGQLTEYITLVSGLFSQEAAKLEWPVRKEGVSKSCGPVKIS